VEYDLDGPASAEKLARIAADHKRDTERENRRSAPATGDEPPTAAGSDPVAATPPVSRLPLLLAGAVLLAATAWYFLRRMNRARE
jgi:hypothetical protein